MRGFVFLTLISATFVLSDGNGEKLYDTLVMKAGGEHSECVQAEQHHLTVAVGSKSFGRFPESQGIPTTAATHRVEDADRYEMSLLHQHNIHRQNHSAAELVWNGTLAEWAADIASTCHFAHNLHYGTGGYGQNLAAEGDSGDISGEKINYAAFGITMQWYNGEVENWHWYDEPNPPADADFDSFGHFTQVVWSSTKQIGCASMQCPAGTVLLENAWYLVCNYSPPGNLGGAYGINVQKPLGQALVTVSF